MKQSEHSVPINSDKFLYGDLSYPARAGCSGGLLKALTWFLRGTGKATNGLFCSH